MSRLPTVRAKKRKNPLLPVDSLAFTVRRVAALPAAHPAEVMASPGVGAADFPRTPRGEAASPARVLPVAADFPRTPQGVAALPARVLLAAEVLVVALAILTAALAALVQKRIPLAVAARSGEGPAAHPETAEQERTSGGQRTGPGGTFSKTSQKMEISQSGAAGTGTPPTSGKPGMGTSGSQPGAAGMGTRSTQRPPATEPRHSRNMPPTTAAPTSGVQSSSPVQQEQRRVPGKDRPPMKGGGSASHPGTAGTAKPPSTKLSSGSMPGSQPGTAGTRSTRRPPASEPRHSRNVPPVTAASPSGAQSSSPAQQEQRRASKKDKLPVKSGGSVPRPGMAGTAPGSRTPPGQKLGGGPSKQKPTRQTKREGGPTSV